jgi:hypothetical protein
MTVETYIDRTRTRVRAEQEAVDAKIEAFEAFHEQVSEIPAEPTPPTPTEPAPSSPASVVATAGTAVRAESATEDRCRAVRQAFAETIRPHSVADRTDTESVLTTIREEFTDAIAVALAPTGETSFSPDLKRALVSETEARQTEAVVLRRALDHEAVQVDDVGRAVEQITDWIVDEDETPLGNLDFEALQDRHETLAGHRDRCESLLAQRQAFLGETTSERVDAGIRHRSLVPYLYQDFPVDHPLLATLVRLEETCRECQRAVRDHLVRRV